jgi:hypothetical protein
LGLSCAACRETRRRQHPANTVSGEKYQFWKREALSIELISPAVFDQKLEYIHNNPVVAGLCNFPEEYLYSSAEFYHRGTDRFGIITHYMGD